MKQLTELFEQWSGEQQENIQQLPLSGSNRTYYRIKGKTKQAIGVINNDLIENYAFFEFSRFFKENKLPVPEIYAIAENKTIYLLQDLGFTTLFNLLLISRNENEISAEIINIYKSVIQWLIKFQLIGKNIDFSNAYPRSTFDKQSMLWDMQYFKYYFLKLAKVSFDEQTLEIDFNRFADFLLETDTNYFLYRDFQSRNIMILDNNPFFIDYQGGRKGALQYDIASLLFDAKADLPNKIREELLDFYINELLKNIAFDVADFRKYYFGYVLIRIMQAMGAYGFRGFYEKKEHFLKSIPYAIKNLYFIINNYTFIDDFPILKNVLLEVLHSDFIKKIANESELCVSIKSFSYKRGIPIDQSEHGGGFVFDCRLLPNPGRFEEYKTKTGRDHEVISFLDKEVEVKDFLSNVYAIVGQSVEKYIKIGYNSLSVNFGCTGGRHRSVYCAEQVAKYLKEKYDIKVEVNHLEMEMLYPTLFIKDIKKEAAKKLQPQQ